MRQHALDLEKEIVSGLFEGVSLPSNRELAFHFLGIGFEN